MRRIQSSSWFLPLWASWALGCGSSAPQAVPPPERVPVVEEASVQSAEPELPIPSATASFPRAFDAAQIAARFETYRTTYEDATYADLIGELGIEQAPADRRLSFDPTSVRYFDVIDKNLQLTAEERAVYRREGLVSVDHGQRYSMASSYYAIYTRDLPVLITTDSILHALHRSYDKVLEELEVAVILPALKDALSVAHDKLRELEPWLTGPLRDSAEDVDLYLSVARSLLAGAGAPAPDDPRAGAVEPRLVPVEQVNQLLVNIASLRMEPPDGPGTALFGGRRPIDYSQFKPRGHYTKSKALQHYFRAMMWLGRADTGFLFERLDGVSMRVTRELRSAALLTTLLVQAGKMDEVERVTSLVGALVGVADNVQPADMHRALSRVGANRLGHLADEGLPSQLQKELATLGPQLIRSQVFMANEDTARATPLPQSFQVFGQRFLVDSYVLSQVVFDSIIFRGKKVRRVMPSGLDVMAALGNDEAVRLLEPQLHRFGYSANLLATRKAVGERAPEAWATDVHQLWLDALRTLDDVPQGSFPEAMQRQAWRRKQLQTQLASWSELRRDNVLYAKQSYTAGFICEYPAGFVEPYPAFYERVGAVAERLVKVLEGEPLRPKAGAGDSAESTRLRHTEFFKAFADTMKVLAHLAIKELAGQPFTDEEAFFLKKTIDIRGGGSGPPTYSGWYPKLIYGGEPQLWEPTIADVHTDANTNKVLQAGVGDVNFLVMAIDNADDRAAYVGPVYSYYEFEEHVSQRLTDQEWQRKIEEGKTPRRPSFTEMFRAKPATRTLPTIQKKPPDPRAARIEELRTRMKTASPEERVRLEAESIQLLRDSLTDPIPVVPEP